MLKTFGIWVPWLVPMSPWSAVRMMSVRSVSPTASSVFRVLTCSAAWEVRGSGWVVVGAGRASQCWCSLPAAAGGAAAGPLAAGRWPCTSQARAAAAPRPSPRL